MIEARGVRCAMWTYVLLAASGVFAAMPETAKFPSRDGKTELVGYVFKPSTPGPHAAVVMLHGRAGLYSSLKPGVVSAGNLSGRHRLWGEFWAARGYLALHVDSFGPRGFAQGFPRGSYKSRPSEVNEQTVRPLDAYGALDYLRGRGDVIADRIGVQGWSNGAMTVLAAIGPAFATDAPRPRATDNRARTPISPAIDFRAAISQYPGCRVQHDEPAYRLFAPLLMLTASDDDETPPQSCEALAARLKQSGADVTFVMYEGAHHAYDDPGKTKQSHAPNKAAMEDTLRRAEGFFQTQLRSDLKDFNK